ncbi:MAG: hypothetical protein HQL96_08525 [Magnetococcales bacterium]|nr:hypothetical protein [Magnetococcales bacterium]
MEKRPYFIVGDLVSNAAAGALAAWVASLLPVGWPMAVEMMAGMALGMVAVFLVSPVFMLFFGALEVMVPTMLGSMFASMLPSMHPVLRGDWVHLLVWGAGIGVASWLFTQVAHFFLRGERNHG